MQQIVILYQDEQERLAYRYAASTHEQMRKQDILISKLIRQSGFPVAHHVLSTPGPTLADLQKTDPYFDHVDDYTEWSKFSKRVAESMRLTSFDVASYIQEQYHIGPFATQKVMYYAYADSLEKQPKPLFRSHFVAFDHGPVDKASYALLKYQPGKAPKYRLRFIAKADVATIKAIDLAVRKYSPVFRDSAAWDREGSNPTHRKGTPWSIAYEEGQNTPITDQDIIKYHKLEAIK